MFHSPSTCPQLHRCDLPILKLKIRVGEFHSSLRTECLFIFSLAEERDLFTSMQQSTRGREKSVNLLILTRTAQSTFFIICTFKQRFPNCVLQASGEFGSHGLLTDWTPQPLPKVFNIWGSASPSYIYLNQNSAKPRMITFLATIFRQWLCIRIILSVHPTPPGGIPGGLPHRVLVLVFISSQMIFLIEPVNGSHRVTWQAPVMLLPRSPELKRIRFLFDEALQAPLPVPLLQGISLCANRSFHSPSHFR